MEINKNNDLSAFKQFPCKLKGKTPLTPNGCKDASNDAQVIAAWKLQFPNCNWGIATGTVSGVFVLDVDINHSIGKYGDISLEELEKSHGKLPETATVLTGGGGKHLYFKMPQGVEIPCSAGKLGTNLDLRSSGGYVVAAESTHENGRTYEWEDGFDPIEDGMPFADAPDWLINLIKRSDRAIMAQSSSGYQYESSEWDCMGNIQRGDFMDALRHCPNDLRDDWLKIGMAIHSMDSTQVGFDLWQAWSMTSDKFDPSDQARVWFSFHNKENKRNKETVFYTARENGWQSEVKKQQLAVVEATGNAITDSINADKTFDPKSYKPEEPIDYEFPHDVEILNQLRGIIKNATDCNINAATTQAVIAIASTLAARRFLTPSGDSCHLHVCVSSSMGTGLGNMRYTSRYIADVLHACGMQAMMRENRISSNQVLYKTLYQSPSTLYICDDYASMIRLSGRQTTGGMEVVLNTITKLHGVQRIHLDSIHDLGLSKSEINPNDDENRPTISHPCLTMFATLGHSDLPMFARVAEMGRGSVEQFLIAICDKSDIEIKTDKEIDIQEEIIQKLYDVRGWTRKEGKREYTFQDAVNAFIETANGQIKVVFEGGEESLVPYDKLIDEVVKISSSASSFKRAARRNIRRLATILAAFNYKNGEYMATKEIIKWCANYVIKHLQKLIDTLSVVSSDDGILNAEQRVLQFLLEKGAEGVPHSALVSDCHSYRHLTIEKRKEVFDKLIGDKMIKSGVRVKQKSGQFSIRVVHSKYNPYPQLEE
jgi:hypothetical protein